ncbi:hypothetical protein [Pandoraea aquatica]|nr:hypothetical protein [Pandoraea aquatica]
MVDLTLTKRYILVTEHLEKAGTDIEHADDGLIEEAHREADKVLGKGKNN